MRKHVRRSLRRYWAAACARGSRLRGEMGSALAELGFFLAFLGVPLLLGTAELAYVMYYSIEIANAAHAGAVYGAWKGTEASNTAKITAAAQAEAADLGSNLTVASTPFYVCSGNEGGTRYTGSNAQATATASCTGTNNHALEFIQVSVTATLTPPFHLPVLPSSFALTRTSVMEVQE